MKPTKFELFIFVAIMAAIILIMCNSCVTINKYYPCEKQHYDPFYKDGTIIVPTTNDPGFYQPANEPTLTPIGRTVPGLSTTPFCKHDFGCNQPYCLVLHYCSKCGIRQGEDVDYFDMGGYRAYEQDGYGNGIWMTMESDSAGIITLRLDTIQKQ